MNVRQIIRMKGSTDVAHIAPDATIAEATQILAEKRYGALLVLDGEGRVAGILSERDIVRGLGERGAKALELRVSDLMTAKVISCGPNDSAVSVMTRMTEGRFRHMPVVEGGKLGGLLSIGDVVKARIHEMESENAAMQDMLSG